MTSKYNPVIAHRGAWKKNNLPENSIASLLEANRLHCQGTEFDVRMTKDEVLVICHDEHHQTMDIEKNNYSDLTKYPLSNAEKIPTLEEYILKGKGTPTRLVLEIKPSPAGVSRSRFIADKVYDLVSEHAVATDICYISFEIEILKQLLKRNKKLPTQYLNGELSPAELKSLGIKGLDYHYSVFKEKHPEWIDEAKKLHLDLNVWTVNSREDLQFFISKKFNQITTNEPELLFDLLNAKK